MARYSGRAVRIIPTGTRDEQNIVGLYVGLVPELLEVEDLPATTLLEIAHGLGRVPRSIRLVNQEVAAGAGPSAVYRESGDRAWTGKKVYVRFSVALDWALLEIL